MALWRRLLCIGLLLPLAGSVQAFNKQNPRWEVPRHAPVPKQTKPYRPLGAPPESVPPRPNAGRHNSRVLAPTVLLAVTALGVAAIVGEWAAAALGLSSTLLLLVTGLVSGPVLGWLQPDRLLGNLLLPILAVGLALLLFYAGLSLHVRAQRLPGPLLSGALIAVWTMGAAGAYYVLHVSPATALALGAVLASTAPPALLPLLRPVDGKTFTDFDAPAVEVVGAILAILVFEAILGGGGRGAGAPAMRGIGATLLAGGLGGWLAARAARLVLDGAPAAGPLQTPLVLALLLAAFGLTNLIVEESGLLTAIVMALGLAHHPAVDVSKLRRGAPAVAVVLGPIMALLMGARLHTDDLSTIGIAVIGFTALVVGLMRPAAVVLATAALRLSWGERLWLATMAPRGVITAALATLFGLRLWEVGYTEASAIPVVALVVLVAIHATGAMAERLAGARVPRRAAVPASLPGTDAAAHPQPFAG